MTANVCNELHLKLGLTSCHTWLQASIQARRELGVCICKHRRLQRPGNFKSNLFKRKKKERDLIQGIWNMVRCKETDFSFSKGNKNRTKILYGHCSLINLRKSSPSMSVFLIYVGAKRISPYNLFYCRGSNHCRLINKLQYKQETCHPLKQK